MNRRLRKAINNSGHAKCEICEQPNILVEHHIRGRKIEHPNHPSNLSYVCSNCHIKIHRGLIIVENRLMTTDGYKLIWHPAGDESITGDDSKPHIY